MKIVVLDGYTLNPGDLDWEGIKKLGDLTVLDRIDHSPSAVIEAIGDAEIIYTNKTPLPKEVLSKVPGVKYIGVLATGFNVVDVNCAKELGIKVTNVPTYGTDAVAQFTLALLLEMCHRIGDHDVAVKNGEWASCPDFCFWKHPLIELSGKTMGFIGFGRIGQATAKLAQAFGLDVLVFNRSQNPDMISDTCKYANLDDVLGKSDIISLHCPLTEDTQGIINQSTIGKMKDGVMIINTARGPLIVEQDLKDALETGKVAAAAIDVASVEPILADNPLLTAKNCIMTPHIAWASKEARQRLMNSTVENLEAFLGGNPINVVNP